MLTKLVISILVAASIVFIIQYFQFRLCTKRLQWINKNILQSAMIYFVHKEMNMSETDDFRTYLKSRLENIKAIKYISNLRVVILADKIRIGYHYFFNGKQSKSIYYELKRTVNIT